MYSNFFFLFSKVKLVFEMVCMLINENTVVLSWDDIRKLMRQDDFLTKIVQFNSLSVTKKQINVLQSSHYLMNKDLTLEAVERVNKIAGYFYKWVKSEIR